MLVTDFILSYILKISKRYGRYICCFGIFACFYLFSDTKETQASISIPSEIAFSVKLNHFYFFYGVVFVCGILLGEEMQNRVPFFFLSSFSLVLLLLLQLSSAQMPGMYPLLCFCLLQVPFLFFNWFP